MKLLIDHADISIIRKICYIYPVDGVTTNPTILSRTKRKPFEVLKEIRAYLSNDAQLHVQVVSRKASDMVNEAHHIQQVLGKETFIKIPVNEDGLQAIHILKKEGANVTATIVLSPMQGFLAAKAGADYIAPYVNRMDNYGFDGVAVAKSLHDMIRNNEFHTEVIGASFKNTQQILELMQYGIGGCTLAPDAFVNLICLDAVESQIDTFENDFTMLCGKHRTMIEESMGYIKAH